MHLLDINVWLALAFVGHEHHTAAKSWFDGLPDDRRCFSCRFTQQGFLRLANNPAAFPGMAVIQSEAWTMYDMFLNDPRVEFADEPPTLEKIWRQLTQQPQFSTKVWGDAYLAAFAQAADLEENWRARPGARPAAKFETAISVPFSFPDAQAVLLENPSIPFEWLGAQQTNERSN